MPDFAELARRMMHIPNDDVEAILNSIVEYYYDALRDGVSPDNAFKIAIEAHRRK